MKEHLHYAGDVAPHLPMQARAPCRWLQGVRAPAAGGGIIGKSVALLRSTMTRLRCNAHFTPFSWGTSRCGLGLTYHRVERAHKHLPQQLMRGKAQKKKHLSHGNVLLCSPS